MSFSSYGFLRYEPYQPQIVEGHRSAEPILDPLDGELYLDVIDYFVLKVGSTLYEIETWSDILIG